MANSLNILNSIRSVASQDYIERIPEATRETLKRWVIQFYLTHHLQTHSFPI